MKTSVYEKAISSTRISSITIIRQGYSSHYWSKPTKCFTTGTRLEMLFNKTTLNYDLSFEKNWQTNRTTETFLTRTIIWFWVTTKRITLKIFFSIYYKFKKIRISLTLYILTSVCRFSIPFSKQFLRCWRGEFDYRSREYLLGDHFLYSHDLTM